jgi:hypothetical protein
MPLRAQQQNVGIPEVRILIQQCPEETAEREGMSLTVVITAKSNIAGLHMRIYSATRTSIHNFRDWC